VAAVHVMTTLVTAISIAVVAIGKSELHSTLACPCTTQSSLSLVADDCRRHHVVRIHDLEAHAGASQLGHHLHVVPRSGGQAVVPRSREL